MFPLKDTISTRTFPVINWLIILANALAFIFIELPLSPYQQDAFFMRWGLVPARLMTGSPHAILTIFTSMFLHGGWFHIISNMWVLYIFGDNVEDRMGSFRYIIFYLLSGVAAAGLQTYLDPTGSAPLIGASGAIAGVLGAYLILYPTARVTTLILLIIIPLFVQIPALVFLAIWFLLQFYSGLSVMGTAAAESGIAYWAHVGGFIFGMIMVWVFARRKPRPVYPDEYRPW